MILRRLPNPSQVPPHRNERKDGDLGAAEAPTHSHGFSSKEVPEAGQNRKLHRAVDALNEQSARNRRTPVPDPVGHLSGWRRWISRQVRTLRVRLSVLTALVVIGSIAIITVASYATVHEILYQETDKTLQTQAQGIVDTEVQDTSLRDRTGRYQPAFRDLTSTMKVMVIPPTQAGAHTNRSLFATTLSDVELDVVEGFEPYSFRSEDDQRFFALKVSDGRVVVAVQDSTVTERALNSLALVLILVAITGSLGAIVMGVAVATAGLQPISRLRRGADRVTETGELRQLPVYSQDELGALTLSFNNMMTALEKSREKQKELVADASHELKTPLTSLRTNIELLMLATKSDNPAITEEDQKDIERDVIGQLEELSVLIGDLVDLAREDGPTYVSETVSIDDVLENALTRAQRRRTDVKFNIHSIPWRIEGDPSSFNRAMLNLLDNAAKWSPENGTVRVWMEPILEDVPTDADDSYKHYGKEGNRHYGAVEIRFADSGPGIPEEDRDKVFDRFYRSIQSRSMPGSGLGLAIVKQVVDRHGGAIIADESDDGGALIRVVLPGWMPLEPGDEENE